MGRDRQGSVRETNNHAASVRVSGTDKREEDREKQMGHKGLAEGPGLRLQSLGEANFGCAHLSKMLAVAQS